MIIQKPVLAVLLLTLAGLAACESTEIGESKDVNQDKIFMDFEAGYTQSDENVSLDFQFRFAGSAGTTLVLSEGSHLDLDGEQLRADSTEDSGAFYHTEKRFNRFIGSHNLVFTDTEGKKYENRFEFSPFTLVNVPKACSPGQDLRLNFQMPSMGANDHIEISNIDSDSSFSIEHKGPGTTITIPARELARQPGKRIKLNCRLIRYIPLTQTSSEGGSFKLVNRLRPITINLIPEQLAD